MKITLKKNNRPKKPGFYLRQATSSLTGTMDLGVAEVRRKSSTLHIKTAMGCYAILADEDDNYWSGALEIEVEK